MTATFVQRGASGHFGGGVAERLNALVLKTSKGLRPSRVRISPPPPKCPAAQDYDSESRA